MSETYTLKEEELCNTAGQYIVSTDSCGHVLQNLLCINVALLNVFVSSVTILKKVAVVTLA